MVFMWLCGLGFETSCFYIWTHFTWICELKVNCTVISTCVESRRSSRCDAVNLQKLSGSTSSNYVEAETSRTFREPSVDGVALQLTGLVGELWDWEARGDMGDKERRQEKEEKRWREGKEEALVLSSKDARITPEVHVQEGRMWTLSFSVKLTEACIYIVLFFFLIGVTIKTKKVEFVGQCCPLLAAAARMKAMKAVCVETGSFNTNTTSNKKHLTRI